MLHMCRAKIQGGSALFYALELFHPCVHTMSSNGMRLLHATLCVHCAVSNNLREIIIIIILV